MISESAFDFGNDLSFVLYEVRTYPPRYIEGDDDPNVSKEEGTTRLIRVSDNSELDICFSEEFVGTLGLQRKFAERMKTRLQKIRIRKR
mgnify:CR=1 FL=1